MKFILHEIKLWFKDDNAEPKSYEFLENKINVITGDSTTGKTSLWNIIDYCLLSSKINVPSTINEKVLWFGIRFSINKKEISIVRKTPHTGVASPDVFFNFGSFPDIPKNNTGIAEVKTILDTEFGITDALRFPYGKGLGKTTFNLSFRHFLLFNSLTQTIIDAPETYFDTTFYGKEEYDKALGHIFDLVIGVNDMENIKALERLQEIERELKKIQNKVTRNLNNSKRYEKDIFQLIEKCKESKFIEYHEMFDDVEDAIDIIKKVITNTKKSANNSTLFTKIDSLYKERSELQSQFNTISKYQREFDLYKRNLSKSADSLQPIEFLNQNLSDQLVDSYETKLFVESLESSLRNIKVSLSGKKTEPLKVKGDIKLLKDKLLEINKKITQLNDIKKNHQAEGAKFIELGKIEYAYEQISKAKINKPIDAIKLNSLNEEKTRLAEVPRNTEEIKFSMKTLLNKSIQRNFNLLNSLSSYRNSRVEFNSDRMILELYPDGKLFPLNNVGSASNYMFMHLCVYLGIHEHIFNIEQSNIPNFLFIDQPSTPYYEGKNDDKAKLIDAFTLLNSFMNYITVEKKKDFQIFMVEHAPKDYWEDNNLSHFHIVDEFISGKGLIPDNVYNN